MKYEELLAIFNSPNSHWVKAADGKMVGKGVMETDLEEQGFTKTELRQLTASSILKKFQVRLNGAIRNSYVLPIGGLNDVRDVEKATEKQPQNNAE